MQEIIDILLFLLPIYAANSIPVLLGGGMPMDMGAKFIDGRPVFGKSKTVRGFIAGVSGGVIFAWVISQFFMLPIFPDAKTQFIAGSMAAVGAMVGDTLGSFIKRRFGVNSGKPFILDTLMFIVIALIFVYPFAIPEFFRVDNIAFILLLTVILHPLTNFIANRTGLKSVPW
jgi:CDP-2,3-bis-(O-geranylgeranyl)-sn-glycerol synthase